MYRTEVGEKKQGVYNIQVFSAKFKCYFRAKWLNTIQVLLNFHQFMYLS